MARNYCKMHEETLTIQNPFQMVKVFRFYNGFTMDLPINYHEQKPK